MNNVICADSGKKNPVLIQSKKRPVFLLQQKADKINGKVLRVLVLSKRISFKIEPFANDIAKIIAGPGAQIIIGAK